MSKESTLNKLLIFSVEGEDSNTEVNYFSGLDDHFTTISISVFAIGKHNSQSATLSRLKLALQKHTDLDCYLNIWILFVGDKDRPDQIPSMNNTIQWSFEFLEENKNLIFDESASLEINNMLIGDDNHKIESSLQRIGVAFPKKSKGKKETFKNLFNESMSNPQWWKNNELDIEKIISELKAIDSKYVKIFEIIKLTLNK